MKPWDIVALGELLIDFTPTRQQLTFEAQPGGAPANLLAAAQRFGRRTAFIGSVGRDAFGDLLIRTLAEQGIDHLCVQQTAEAFTTLAFVVLAKDGDRDFAFSRKPGADTLLHLTEEARTRIAEAAIFHFGTLSLTADPSRTATQEAVTFAAENGLVISFDPNYRAPLWPDQEAAAEAMRWGAAHTNIIKLGRDELLFMYGATEEAEAVARLFEEPQLRLALVTDGARGCRFYLRQEALVEGFVPAFRLDQTIDTTGAGDIFTGITLALLLEQGLEKMDLDTFFAALPVNTLTDILRTASAGAALSTTQHGGIGSVPTRERVAKFLVEFLAEA